MTQLHLLPWFQFKKRQLDWFCVAAANGLLRGNNECPPGWTKPPRQQLDAFRMATDQEYTITWDVPQSELEQALSSQETTQLHSSVLYAAGSGWQLQLRVEKEEGSKPRGIGVFLTKCSYECQGEEIAPEAGVTQVKFTITHQPPGPARRRTVVGDSPTLVHPFGWGLRGAFKASSMSDLQPHLIDGYLKLGATFQVTH
jgi:hypothetical protein